MFNPSASVFVPRSGAPGPAAAAPGSVGSYSELADASTGLFFQYPPPNGSVRGAPTQMTPQQQYAFAGPGPQPVTVPQQQYMYAAPQMYQPTGFYMPTQMAQMVATPPQMGGPGQAAPVSVAGVPRPQPTQTPPVINVPPISQIGMQMQAPQVPQNMGMGPQHMPQMSVPAVTVPAPLSSSKPQQRSRSKAIAIIDPETGKNVMETEEQPTQKADATESAKTQVRMLLNSSHSTRCLSQQIVFLSPRRSPPEACRLLELGLRRRLPECTSKPSLPPPRPMTRFGQERSSPRSFRPRRRRSTRPRPKTSGPIRWRKSAKAPSRGVKTFKRLQFILRRSQL
jgi:hypothetical protein